MESVLRATTRDLDAAADVLDDVYDTTMELRAAAVDGFRFSLEAAGGSEFGVGRLFCGGDGTTGVEAFSSYIVAMAVGGDLSWRIGRDRGRGPDPFLIRPSRRMDAAWSDMDLATVSVDAGAVDAAARASTGRDDAGLAGAAPAADLRYMRAVIRHLHAVTLRSPDLLDSPLVLRSLQQSAAQAMLVTYRVVPEPRELPVAGPRTVRRAVGFLDEHLADPITIADAAIAAGISMRAMEAAFRRHLGRTPRDYLRSARLAAARTELELADPAGATVAAVAARWGFAHAARFARDYRAAFGEPPSATLRR
jgi:AraC-like DNA-binding protein